MTSAIFSNSYVNGMSLLQEAQIEFETRQRMSRAGYPLDCFSSDPPPSGSVIISDSFTPAPFDEAKTHGEVVAQATRSTGFKGKVLVQEECFESPHLEDLYKAQQAFFSPMSPQQTRANIKRFTRANALVLLEEETASINKAKASGARNSALNLSQGASIASMASIAYATAKGAWQKDEPASLRLDAQTVARNLAQGLGVNYNNLVSSDSHTSGPERAKLQQALIDTIGHTIRSDKKIRSAKKEFAEAVNRFESAGNSVVIAAGNEGAKLKMMQEDACGYNLRQVPKDFTTNLLDTPEATMVGATSPSDSSPTTLPRVADYSSLNDGVDIYAPGDVLEPTQPNGKYTGTSFSAPRVAAIMATLHYQHPNLSSSQIENLMSQSLSSQLTNGNSTLLSIDEEKVTKLMRRKKY